jgi:ribosomal 30S subunit maturation factor RimM
MKVNSDQNLAIGYFGSPHGIRGGLSIFMHTIPFDITLDQSCFYHQDQQIVYLDISKLESHHKKDVIYLANISNRNDAQSLTGLAIYTDRERFFTQHPEQAYGPLCSGYQVYDLQNQMVGVLDSIDFINDIPMALISRDGDPLRLCALPEYIEYIDHQEMKFVLKKK